VTQRGKGAIDGASITDDLSDVLDDATIDESSITASAGKASLSGKELDWTGDLKVGDVVTISYTVTVVRAGDDDLVNPVTSDDHRGSCDKAVGCRVEHPKGKYIFSKVSDPKSGATVKPGDTIDYTITVTQQGKAGIKDATLTDDLSGVLDDAKYNGDAKASVGTASVKGDTLSWTGDLKVGAVETITYSVTVTNSGDDHVVNKVTSTDPRGTCDEKVGCSTEQQKGRFVFSKTSDPESGSVVQVGDKITYTITVAQRGPAAIDDASITDDMTKVLDDARYNGDVKASSGTATVKGDTLTWTGDLATKQVVRITYSVTTTGAGDDQLANVVASTDARGSCDTSIGCRTNHRLPGTGTGNEQPPAGLGSGGLASTGSSPILAGAIGVGLALILGGGVLLVTRRRTAGNR
jgi:fimbrial isopeptide formation D2 family protein/uncharacterized repeat protein (TIGR01451 family)